MITFILTVSLILNVFFAWHLRLAYQLALEAREELVKLTVKAVKATDIARHNR